MSTRELSTSGFTSIMITERDYNSSMDRGWFQRNYGSGLFCCIDRLERQLLTMDINCQLHTLVIAYSLVPCSLFHVPAVCCEEFVEAVSGSDSTQLQLSIRGLFGYRLNSNACIEWQTAAWHIWVILCTWLIQYFSDSALINSIYLGH